MLQQITDWIVYGLLGMEHSASLSESLNFFIYDSVKILLLLFVMIAAIGFLRTYISQEKIKKALSGRRLGFGNLLAALFGAATPFCSCSSIPIFLGMLEAGVPLGVTFSFLITSPLINQYLVVLMLGFFGWKITVAYVLSGIIIGVVAGIILGKMKLEKHMTKNLITQKINRSKEKFDSIKERVDFGIKEAVSIVKKLWAWILVGVGIGAIIHNYIPEEMIHSLMNRGGILTVPFAVILGVPIYASCAAIIPVAVVLFQKGIPLGTTLAFVMATSALSLPEAVILRRAMKLKLIALFFGIVTLGIILTGYLLNFLQPILA